MSEEPYGTVASSSRVVSVRQQTNVKTLRSNFSSGEIFDNFFRLDSDLLK